MASFIRRLATAFGGILVALALAFSAAPAALAEPRVAELNQGWSRQEVDLYHHASEGTNLSPLAFALALPDPQRPGRRFMDGLEERYGFIPSQPSDRNPHNLPVGFSIDPRPEAFGDRPFLGMTCATCHTRELSYTQRKGLFGRTTWRLPVHGGPSLVNLPAFNDDFYNAFLALLKDDGLMARFARDVLDTPAGESAGEAEISQLRTEIQEFIGPVLATRQVLETLEIPGADFGPGNLNALSQGNYNNVGLAAWLVRKGLMNPSGEQPLRIGFEGTVNYPPVWFSPHDNWAQWFAEIHHPGSRNWVQSVSSSPVRPPKMIATLREKAIIASVDFDSIEAIQEAVTRLRTPQWPEPVLGRLDQGLIATGAGLFQQNCARCHVRTPLPPNPLGNRFNQRQAFAVGTDPVAYDQFAQDGAARAFGLCRLSEGILQSRRAQLNRRFDNDETLVASYERFDSKGLPNRFDLARPYRTGPSSGDGYATANVAEEGAPGAPLDCPQLLAQGPPTPAAAAPALPATYWAPPMEGIFASGPYLHNGSVPTLSDLLTPPAQRPSRFHTGSNALDPVKVGLRDEGPFLYDTSEKGKGNGGHPYGTTLPTDQKRALLEYLKSR